MGLAAGRGTRSGPRFAGSARRTDPGMDRHWSAVPIGALSKRRCVLMEMAHTRHRRSVGGRAARQHVAEEGRLMRYLWIIAALLGIQLAVPLGRAAAQTEHL